MSHKPIDSTLNYWIFMELTYAMLYNVATLSRITSRIFIVAHLDEATALIQVSLK